VILERLSLHNYGLFKGRQEIEFPPPQQNRPIVLIGGLNGNGKTTILEALQLVLYGRSASFWNTGKDSYSEFLKNSIHRGVNPCEGAKIELSFLSDIDGHEREYRLQRSWHLKRKKIAEHVQVFLDGQLDQDLSERWDEEVLRHLPARLASLFFFDGEKIEDLADISKSQELLQQGIHSLLGINLIDQLNTDLLVVLTRQSKAAKSKDSGDEHKSVAIEVKLLREQKEDKQRTIAQIRGDLYRLNHEVEEIESKFASEGGELFEQRLALEKDKQTAINQRKACESELAEIASNHLPLKRVAPLLKQIQRRARREERTQNADQLLEVLRNRDQKLLCFIATLKEAGDSEEAIQGFLAHDRAKLESVSGEPVHLNLSRSARSQLDDLLGGQLNRAAKCAHKIVQDIGKNRNQTHRLTRQLAQVPEAERIADITKKRDSKRGEANAMEGAIKREATELRSIEFRLKEAETKLTSMLKADALMGFEQDVAGRVRASISQVKTTLEEFKLKLVARQTSRLESLIFDSYQHLLRKKSLVGSVHIDPKDSSLELRATSGEVLNPRQLSQGERQLLAVSLVWALARAVGRPLPMVIDTPLGRLDSKHRANLTDHYFPHASHQVILLSTDEEINESLHKRIKKRVGGTFQLVHDDRESSTTIQPGYFWGT